MIRVTIVLSSLVNWLLFGQKINKTCDFLRKSMTWGDGTSWLLSIQLKSSLSACKQNTCSSLITKQKMTGSDTKYTDSGYCLRIMLDQLMKRHCISWKWSNSSFMINLPVLLTCLVELKQKWHAPSCWESLSSFLGHWIAAAQLHNHCSFYTHASCILPIIFTR